MQPCQRCGLTPMPPGAGGGRPDHFQAIQPHPGPHFGPAGAAWGSAGYGGKAVRQGAWWPSPQVTCHELCHLLGLGNCRWLRCLMQGALSLDEALRRPLDLCPICLRKLQHILGFRLIERYQVSCRVALPELRCPAAGTCALEAPRAPPGDHAGHEDCAHALSNCRVPGSAEPRDLHWG